MGGVPVAPDHVVVVKDSEKTVQLYLQAGFFPDFAQRRLFIGFVHFHQAADQAPFAVVGSALEKNFPFPNDHRAGTVQNDLPRADFLSKFMNVIHTNPSPSVGLYAYYP